MPDNPRTIKIDYNYLAAHQILYTNAQRFTHLGTDIILDVGLVDDQQVVKLIQEGKLEAVNATVTHRFAMSVQTFLKLKENVDDMLRKLVAAEIIEPVPAEEAKEEK